MSPYTLTIKSILAGSKLASKNPSHPRLVKKFSPHTKRRNQLLGFAKPEVFAGKTASQAGKILDQILKKFTEYEVFLDGIALFTGPSLEKNLIMDRHYGVINQLSKFASKILSPKDRQEVYLALKSDTLPILGGHEAFPLSGIAETGDFDRYWLEEKSTRIRSGFYVRVMSIGKENVIVVNGFHPHQLAYYNGPKQQLTVMLLSTDSPWKIVREKMLGDAFPEKAEPSSIRGIFYRQAKQYGFDSVTIANNILHLSAGPTEALFEINNFLAAPFKIDVFTSKGSLAHKLLKAGLTKAEIKNLLTNGFFHSSLEHQDSNEAVRFILKNRSQLKK